MLTINAHSDTNTLIILIIRVGQIQSKKYFINYILCKYPYLFEIYNQVLQFPDLRNYRNDRGLKIMLTIYKEVICQTYFQMVEMTRNCQPKKSLITLNLIKSLSLHWSDW